MHAASAAAEATCHAPCIPVLKQQHAHAAAMLAAAALLLAAGCCWWLLLVLAAAVQQPAASSSSQQQPAAEQQQPAAASMGMAAAWLLHGHAAASKPGCMVHGMLAASKPGCMVHGMSLQQQLLLRACMRACVAAFVIDTIYELTRRRRPGRGESNFRIEIFAKVRHGQKGEFGARTPALSALLPLAGQICLS
jgi:hypothetical protein